MSEFGQYPTEIFWSDDDEGYIAIVPDLPGCSAFGETRAEALSELDDAIASWMAAAEAAGNPVPGPSEHSSLGKYSGKFHLRMPKELHRDLVAGANQQSTSLNSYICYLLGKAHYSATATATPTVSATATVAAPVILTFGPGTEVFPHATLVGGVQPGTCVKGQPLYGGLSSSSNVTPWAAPQSLSSEKAIA